MSAETPTVPRVKLLTHLAICPHCGKELRVASKYVGQEVNCRFCSQKLLVEAEDALAANGSLYTVAALPLEMSLTTEGTIPHWPAALERQLNVQALRGYRFVRSFPVGDHLALVFEKAAPAAETSQESTG